MQPLRLLVMGVVLAVSACGSAPSPSPSASQPIHRVTTVPSPGLSSTPAPTTANSYSLPAPTGTNPGFGIIGVQTARGVAADGSAQNPTSTFSSATDHALWIVIQLADLPAGTAVSFVRYLNNNFVDSKTSYLKGTAKYFYFDFSPQAGKAFTPGSYRARLYVNEHAAWEVLYTIS